MSSERRIASCTHCGEEREIAAHNLCFRCYRASERAAENPWAAADRHNRAKLRAQKRLRTAVTAILNAVDGVIELMEEEHVNTVRAICGHYLLGLASGLPAVSGKSEDAVNSEHVSMVNRSQQPLDDMPNVADAEQRPERTEDRDGTARTVAKVHANGEAVEQKARQVFLKVEAEWESEMSEDDPRIVHEVRLSEGYDDKLIKRLHAAMVDNNIDEKSARHALYSVGFGAFAEKVLAGNKDVNCPCTE